MPDENKSQHDERDTHNCMFHSSASFSSGKELPFRTPFYTGSISLFQRTVSHADLTLPSHQVARFSQDDHIADFWVITSLHALPSGTGGHCPAGAEPAMGSKRRAACCCFARSYERE